MKRENKQGSRHNCSKIQLGYVIKDVKYGYGHSLDLVNKFILIIVHYSVHFTDRQISRIKHKVEANVWYVVKNHRNIVLYCVTSLMSKILQICF